MYIRVYKKKMFFFTIGIHCFSSFPQKKKKGWVFMLHAHSKVLRAGSEAGIVGRG